MTLGAQRLENGRGHGLHRAGHSQQRVASLYDVLTATVEDRVFGVLEHPGRRVRSLESGHERTLSGADLGFVERRTSVHHCHRFCLVGPEA